MSIRESFEPDNSLDMHHRTLAAIVRGDEAEIDVVMDEHLRMLESLFESIGGRLPTRRPPSFLALLRAPRRKAYCADMCRNITPLRGLEPEATPTENEAAALQYVRKVGGVQTPSAKTAEAIERAVQVIAAATTELLAALPPRQHPPLTLPPLRRRAAASAG